MSVLGNIMSAIFGHGAAKAQPTSAAGAAGSAPGPSVPSPDISSSVSSTTPLPQVDVEAVLTNLASQNKEKLDWRRSIVDLMKLVKLDSSLSARQELAKELNYTGDAKDSAAMNVWLHKQVMAKLAANGGKLPNDMKT
jgi:uncharacterized protein DUF3597